MKIKHWIRKTIIWVCLPLLSIIGLGAFAVYIKVKFDFPAKTDGYSDLKIHTGIIRKEGRVYVRHTGWEDTQSYLRFEATEDEIEFIIDRLKLAKSNGMPDWASFYWWSAEKCEACQFYEEKEGNAWSWLRFDASNNVAHYLESTF